MTAVPSHCDEPPAARLERLQLLLQSLERSQTALLALHLDGIQRGTREQSELLQKCTEMAGHVAARKSTSLEGELRQYRQKVGQAARLQLALLSRAQSKLRILSRALAGREAFYRPFHLSSLAAEQGRRPQGSR